jgi:hypothetical protein
MDQRPLPEKVEAGMYHRRDAKKYLSLAARKVMRGGIVPPRILADIDVVVAHSDKPKTSSSDGEPKAARMSDAC